MKRISILALGLTLLAPAGCGLIFAGALLGVRAAQKSSARKQTIKAMKPHNDAAAVATKSGNHRRALGHLKQAQTALNAYLFRWEGKTKASAVAAEYPEIGRTARGLVISHLALKNYNQAAAVAAQMLPSTEAHRHLQRMRMVSVSPEAVSTAPHQYRGSRTQWEGEVILARHNQRSNTTWIRVVPYSWQRRQTGLRSQRYWDSQLRIHRYRLVPVYRTFKVPLRNKAFTVRLRGYNQLLVPGCAASFVGNLGVGRGATLAGATAAKILSKPGGQVLWYLGAPVRKG